MRGSCDPRGPGDAATAAYKYHSTETRSITFEWPLFELGQHFDSSKADVKSKVIKSVSFGEGKWTVFFYAQSGIQQFCSLYLNAEPLPEEKANPLLASPSVTSTLESTQTQPKTGKLDPSLPDEKWSREGLYRFTFKILTLDKSQVLATKEAHDHAFSQKTSNWGWAQFASRDAVFFNNSAVRNDNAFVISVSITANAERPRAVRPLGISVPPALVQAMGSLLDDPDHSDIVFTIGRQRHDRASGRLVTRERKIYAIKKILASRCEYFEDMFEGGFLEADAVESSDEDHDARGFKPKPSSGVGQDRQEHNDEDEERFSSDEDMAFDDSDEELFESDREEEHEAEDHELRSDPISVDVPQSSNDDALASSDEDEGVQTEQVVALHARRSTAETQPTEAVRVTNGAHSASTPDDTETVQLVQRSSAGGSVGGNMDDVTDSGRIRSNSAFQTPSHSPRSPLVEGAAGNRAVLSRELKPAHPVRNQRALQRSMAGASAPRRTAGQSDTGRTGSSGKKRRKVVVRDAAYSTFRSLLYYLYTDTVEFAPLTSSFLTSVSQPEEGRVAAVDSNDSTMADSSMSSRTVISGFDAFSEERRRAHMMRQSVIDAYCMANPSHPSPCSAKSMYRLADKLQIPDLKRRAQEHIANSLTVQNIVWEVFSGFNVRFPDVRKMETDFLLKHWPKVKRTKAMKTIFSRPMAHPGLAEVWPYLLSQLEYTGSSPDSPEAAKGER